MLDRGVCGNLKRVDRIQFVQILNHILVLHHFENFQINWTQLLRQVVLVLKQRRHYGNGHGVPAQKIH